MNANTPAWMSGLTAVLAIIVIFGIMWANASRAPQRMQQCYQQCHNAGAPTWSYSSKHGCSCGGTTE